MKTIPGRRTPCRTCRAPIVFAKVLKSESGRGGGWMALDPDPNPDGNVAVRPGHGGRLICRVLKKDETHDHAHELRAMPHAATCEIRAGKDLVEGVEAFLRDSTNAHTEEK